MTTVTMIEKPTEETGFADGPALRAALLVASAFQLIGLLPVLGLA